MTLLEKILALHSKSIIVKPGQIIDAVIDIRVARDFGGANVVRNIRDNGLSIEDPQKTLFTFDCNPTGSDQKYAVNQHICRLFAREHDIHVFDIDAGIGTHLLIDEGYVCPGMTAVSTDSHANILGAIGAFGQGMGDMDIAAAWNKGKIWFKVPPSVRIELTGLLKTGVTAKDLVLNLLNIFGPDTLLGCSVEIYGQCIDKLNLDQRMTISSMATEMGAIIILFPPSEEITGYCRVRSGKKFGPLFADPDAVYHKTFEIDVSEFLPMISRPGAPSNTIRIPEAAGQKIDSAFIGSCTNGRMEDMRKTAEILKDKKIAPDVVLKIVPATDRIWKECLDKGIIEIFKNAGALVSNAGCAGCAAGQVGQNGQGEITISTGNRNFTGKQGKGDVYLASPEVVAASAIAGYITTPDKLPASPSRSVKSAKPSSSTPVNLKHTPATERPEVIKGRIWLIPVDNIDTDMIYHNRYLGVTDISEMGQYAFDNLKGYEDFSRKAQSGDIIVTGRNFGCGSSRQHAVDCFLSLGIRGIVAESFGAIYERNAINAALPIITCNSLKDVDLNNGDVIEINFKTGLIDNQTKRKHTTAEPFSDVQLEIYHNGGLL